MKDDAEWELGSLSESSKGTFAFLSPASIFRHIKKLLYWLYTLSTDLIKKSSYEVLIYFDTCIYNKCKIKSVFDNVLSVTKETIKFYK